MSSPAVFLLLLLCIFTLLTSSAPLTSRDVYVPPVLYPHNGTVWNCGEHHNVTWDNSNPPVSVTNRFGMVVLRKAGLEDIDHPLATNIDMIEYSRVEILVPTVPTRQDYQIVVFGDSGNFSPEFTIICD